jgi:hypothetical protein
MPPLVLQYEGCGGGDCAVTGTSVTLSAAASVVCPAGALSYRASSACRPSYSYISCNAGWHGDASFKCEATRTLVYSSTLYSRIVDMSAIRAVVCTVILLRFPAPCRCSEFYGDCCDGGELANSCAQAYTCTEGITTQLVQTGGTLSQLCVPCDPAATPPPLASLLSPSLWTDGVAAYQYRCSAGKMEETPQWLRFPLLQW